ncbi:hypothetical protein HPB50_007479 [Hyalomma asiaticum]|uniref:Uncharacterized protein n=1 Tax=Hyalomma asiaticum TaxID=266040 RepID=A0ACB7SNY1_HYAAI|nr:hypothetical protein HPB50_007479 [Hyalomma asiaticum]
MFIEALWHANLCANFVSGWGFFGGSCERSRCLGEGDYCPAVMMTGPSSAAVCVREASGADRKGALGPPQDAVKYENGREIRGQSVVVEWARGPSFRPSAGKQTRQAADRPRDRMGYQSFDECYRCRRTGHWARDCPELDHERARYYGGAAVVAAAAAGAEVDTGRTAPVVVALDQGHRAAAAAGLAHLHHATAE